MKQRALLRVLTGLIEECGYETVRKALGEMSPSSLPPFPVVKSPRRATKRRAQPPSAQAVVVSLGLPDGSRKRVLARLAEKYEQKTFMPDVCHVRAFLGEGVGGVAVKSRQQATLRVFKRLAELPEEDVLQIERSGHYGPPKTATDVANAIHAFSQRQQQEERRSS